MDKQRGNSRAGFQDKGNAVDEEGEIYQETVVYYRMENRRALERGRVQDTLKAVTFTCLQCFQTQIHCPFFPTSHVMVWKW